MKRADSSTPASMNRLAGLRLGCAASGERYHGRDDLLLVTLPPRSRVAGMFTRSSVVAAPVRWCRRHIAAGRARALLVNAGNANACTGRQGDEVAALCAAAVAQRLDCPPAEVLLASTGMIGEPLPSAPLLRGLKQAWARLGDSEGHWQDAARAIMTTDTVPKMVSQRLRLDGKEISINGIAKGSGMIAPDMATMLAFFFTDAAVPRATLEKMLRAAVEASFHRISIDGDNSTNDSVLLFATGEKGGLSAGALRQLAEALRALAVNLARRIVRDGEGAKKFVTIEIAGASSRASARRVALAIANSPLVKTALSGEDANWGRIAMAIGKSGERISLSRLGIAMGGVVLARNGAAVSLSPARKRRLERHMKEREIHIGANLGVGRGACEVWTCDLSHEYVSINGEYRS